MHQQKARDEHGLGIGFKSCREMNMDLELYLSPNTAAKKPQKTCC